MWILEEILRNVAFISFSFALKLVSIVKILRFKTQWNSVLTNSVVNKQSVIMNRISSQIGYFSTQINPVITNPGSNSSNFKIQNIFFTGRPNLLHRWIHWLIRWSTCNFQQSSGELKQGSQTCGPLFFRIQHSHIL